MIFLKAFSLPTEDMEIDYLSVCGKFRRTCYDTKYPFGMFSGREFPESFEFSDITVFCGNNGSGKSTVLNLIAERLNAEPVQAIGSKFVIYRRSDNVKNRKIELPKVNKKK